MRTMDHFTIAAVIFIIALSIAGSLMVVMPGCADTATTTVTTPATDPEGNPEATSTSTTTPAETTDEVAVERTEPGDDERSLGDPAPRPEATERTKAREIDELRSVMGDIGAGGTAGSRARIMGEALAGAACEEPAYASISDATRTRAARVNAASHDDNEEYLPWLEFMSRNQNVPMALPADFTDRVIVRITDAEGRPYMNRAFSIRAGGKTVWRGTTYADGEAVVYPNVFFRGTGEPTAVAIGESGDMRFPWEPGRDGIMRVELGSRRHLQERLPVDIAFIIDATGSMGDEIQQLRDVLHSIHARLQEMSGAADLRFGMVVYRDRNDGEPLAVVPFTNDVNEFRRALWNVSASGGGDYPEDLQRGLTAALDNLQWRDDAIRAGFILADAPPHTDYSDQQRDYLWSSREANSRGIRIHAIGASGLRLDGEYIFRQIAATTAGQFIFLTYGESGESSGAATPSDPGRVSHHTGENFSSRRLDDIVVNLVKRDLAYQIELPEVGSTPPPPEAQSDMLSLRMKNLWGQIARQISDAETDTLTAVLLPFDDTISDTALAGYLHDLSVEMVLENVPVTLVERERIDAVLTEQGYMAGGLISETAAIELGNLLGGRMVLCGKLYALGTDRVVHVRAIDSETARIVAAARVRV